MSYAVGQLSYSLVPAEAEPGALADNEVNHIVGLPAAEAINPGRGLEMATDGASVQQVQQTSSTLNLIGFALLQPVREGVGNSNLSTVSGSGAPYNIGDMVPVLRKGAMFAEWKGTTQTSFGKPNMYHSSTLAADRGKLTDTSTSTGAGVEIAACPSGVQLRKARTGSGNIALVEVNLPGAA